MQKFSCCVCEEASGKAKVPRTAVPVAWYNDNGVKEEHKNY